jgi:hypothetical protein
MGNLSSALQQLREERKRAQSHVEKLDTAISVIESLNGSGTFGHQFRRVHTLLPLQMNFTRGMAFKNLFQIP